MNQISKELDNKIEENFYLMQQKDELQKNLDTANNEKNDVETRLTETLCIILCLLDQRLHLEENVQLKAEKDGIANRLPQLDNLRYRAMWVHSRMGPLRHSE